MSSQLFKNTVHLEHLLEFLNLNCEVLDNSFIFSIESFKRGIFNNSIPLFLERLKDYYRCSKHKYIEAKPTFKSFATVIRQICKHLGIPYTVNIKYTKSTYNMIYTINLSA
jgi:hypothetical protein